MDAFSLFLAKKKLFPYEDRDYLSEYGGKWDVISKKWRDEAETLGLDSYNSGYIRFEFTEGRKGKLRYFYDYYEEYYYQNHYYSSYTETNFEIIDNRFVVEKL